MRTVSRIKNSQSRHKDKLTTREETTSTWWAGQLLHNTLYRATTVQLHTGSDKTRTVHAVSTKNKHHTFFVGHGAMWYAMKYENRKEHMSRKELPRWVRRVTRSLGDEVRVVPMEQMVAKLRRE